MRVRLSGQAAILWMPKLRPIKCWYFSFEVVAAKTGLLADARVARTSVFACDENLGAGRIHFARASQITGGWSHPLGGGTQIKSDLSKQVAFYLVRLRGLEPLPVTGMEPKSIVYTNFTTGAYLISP